MNIAIASIFRNSAAYVARYANQVAALRDALAAEGHTLRVVAAEGDSVDWTPHLLVELLGQFEHTILTRAHGGPSFGSVDVTQRWRQIAWVCNELLDELAAGDDDLVIYVESDLIWQPATMLRLLGHVAGARTDVACPLSLSVGTSLFYDTWGHRSLGRCFEPHAPYHPMLAEPSPTGLYPLESAGSCLVMLGEVARAARFQPDDGIVGWGRDIRARGYTIALDPTVKVEHP